MQPKPPVLQAPKIIAPSAFSARFGTINYNQKRQVPSPTLYQQTRQQQTIRKMQLQHACAICFHELNQKVVQVETCQHTFHTDCLANYVSSKKNDRIWPIRCPEACQAELTIKELQSLYNSQQLGIMMSYIDRKFLQNNPQQFTFCPGAGCKNGFEFEGDNYEFFCYGCEQAYCLKCRTIYHYGMTCDEFRQQPEFKSKELQETNNDQLFLGYVQDQNLKQCPKCSYWIQRTQGCLHIKCVCKYEFCFRCLGKYKQCQCGG